MFDFTLHRKFLRRAAINRLIAFVTRRRRRLIFLNSNVLVSYLLSMAQQTTFSGRTLYAYSHL